jgi:UDPglucose 6-dehydrogenase
VARILVVGAGLVGVAVGEGFTRTGHDIGFVDVDRARVDALRTEGRDAATEVRLPVHQPVTIFLTVDTPGRDGRHDLTALCDAATAVGRALTSSRACHTVVVRSTVPPGTCDGVLEPLLARASGRAAGDGFHLVCCPEFLRAAHALDDVLAPRVTVVGGRAAGPVDAVAELFRPFGGALVTFAEPTSAELVKCAQNAWNATKISFWNEMWLLARELGVAADEVADAVGLAAEGVYNPRYGTRGGRPFAGSCLPKDTEGLVAAAADAGVPTPLLRAVLEVNRALGEHARPTPA